jgi:hypothetical protein
LCVTPPVEGGADDCAANIPLDRAELSFIPIDVAELSALPFQSACFREARFRPVELTQVFRQEAGRLVRCLEAVRKGAVAPGSEAHALFATELGRELPARDDGVEPTRLYARNASVDATNASRLAQMTTERHTFHASDSVVARNGAFEAALRAESFFGKRFKGVLDERDCAAPELLVLAVGAQVMLTANLVPGLLANSSRGVVGGFSELALKPPRADACSDADSTRGADEEGVDAAERADDTVRICVLHMPQCNECYCLSTVWSRKLSGWLS